MSPGDPRASSGRERLSGALDEVKASFGLPAGLAMLAGVVLGFGLPAIDNLLDLDLPIFSFETQDAARSLLETVATVTVSVAGLAFSVTIVAFTLTSSQLSPRVLRSFRSDRLSQAVLAVLLGTFIYCLSVLVRLGTRESGAVPNLSITFAMLLALISFALFALFIGHIARMLQPSTVIARIVSEARGALGARFPAGIGEAPERPDEARQEARNRSSRRDPVRVESDGEGYLSLIQGGRLMEAAEQRDALVRQCVVVGDYVTPTEVLAEVWAEDLPEGDREALVATVRDAFVLAQERSLVQDVAFSVRQLSDIALKGLSPGINDPSTAENAMDAMTAVIIHFARSEQPCELRVDGAAKPRFVARVADLNDVVRLGFAQVRVFAAADPVASVRMLVLLERISRAAREVGLDHAEVTRQAALLSEGAAGEAPTVEDANQVRQAHARLHPRA